MARKVLRWWPWILLGSSIVLVSGLVPPRSLGLAPTAGALRARFEALEVGPHESAREIVERMGYGEPDLAVVRLFLPGGLRGSSSLLAPEGEAQIVGRAADLQPMDGSQAEWLQLMWKPMDPWLIELLDRAARKISPGAETIVWTLKERVLPKHEVFEIIGSRAYGWEAGAGPWAGGSPAGERVQSEAKASLSAGSSPP